MEKKSPTPGLIIWGEKNWLLGTLTGDSGATSMCCGAPVLLLQVRKEVRLLIYIHIIFCNMYYSTYSLYYKWWSD